MAAPPALLEQLLQRIDAPTAAVDENDALVFFNAAFEALAEDATGRAPRIGEPLYDIAGARMSQVILRGLEGARARGTDVAVVHDWGRTHRAFEITIARADDGRTAFLTFSEVRQPRGLGPPSLQVLLDNVTELIVIVDRDLNVLGCNRLFGASVGSLRGRDVRIGEPLEHCALPESWPVLRSHYERALRGEVMIVDSTIVVHGGFTRTYELSFNPLREGDEIVGVVAIGRNVTQRRADATELARVAEERRQILEAIPDAITTLRRDGTIADFKPGALVPTPMPPADIVGKHLGTFGHVNASVLLGALAEAFSTRRTVVLEYEAMVDGVARVRDARLRAVSDDEALLVVRDVTDQRRLLARMAAAERLTALGTLAAGVAHELNNPLAIVVASLEHLRDELDDLRAPALSASVASAFSGAERMRRIIRDFLAFSRSDDDTVGLVSVERALRTALELAQRSLRSVARVVVQLAPVRAVRANEGQLAQVFVNLLANAAQAFEGLAPERDREVRVWLGERGDEVVAEVTDNGVGIAPAHLGRVFEPFFTTKPVGTGTGLGLWVCIGIVQRAGGRMEVESEPGSRTTFRVVLPASVVAPAVQASPRGPRPRVLIIDDDRPLAMALGALLERDLDVELAARGAEGLARLAREPAFDLVLCDLVMPDLSGADVAERAGALGLPASRFVLMSGGPLDRRERAIVEKLGVVVLEKPFAREAVLEALRRAGGP